VDTAPLKQPPSNTAICSPTHQPGVEKKPKARRGAAIKHGLLTALDPLFARNVVIVEPISGCHRPAEGRSVHVTIHTGTAGESPVMSPGAGILAVAGGVWPLNSPQVRILTKGCWLVETGLSPAQVNEPVGSHGQ
jgi:hypothetical protein